MTLILTPLENVINSLNAAFLEYQKDSNNEFVRDLLFKDLNILMNYVLKC